MSCQEAHIPTRAAVPKSRHKAKEGFFCEGGGRMFAPWAETFSLGSRRQVVLSFGSWFFNDSPDELSPRVAAVRACAGVTVNPTAHLGCSTCQSVTPPMQRACFTKRDFGGDLPSWNRSAYSLQTAGTRHQTPFSLVGWEGKSIFSNGCSRCWPPDFSPWLRF